MRQLLTFHRIPIRYPGALAVLILLCLSTLPLQAEDRDVPYIQTPQSVVLKMLEMADVGPDDTVLDLGSGDGRIPILAARDFAARGRGIEIDPGLVDLARRNAEAAGVADQVSFEQADLFDIDLSGADVITLYLLPELNLRLRPRLLALAPGTRVVSHEFDMGEWPADQEESLRNRDLYLWIVPADVAGRWQLRHGEHSIQLTLEQHFQAVSGHARIGDKEYPLQDVSLRGEQLRFRLAVEGRNRVFTGRVEKQERLILEARPALSDGRETTDWTGRRLPSS